ncbi:MAG: DNA primase [Clostridiales bacterium]|nr:DNA primase [Clostridiales bacterium]
MANFYPDEVIEEIIEKNDIVDVVSDYVKITRKGKDYFGLCPFHREKTPSFSVVPAKQIFYCFGCGKGGNVINFIKNIENVEFLDALKMLADRASIQLPESNDKNERQKCGYYKKLVEINTEAARHYYSNVKDNPGSEADLYIQGRKIKEGTIVRFGIGYANDKWDSLLKHLKAKGYIEKDIETAGLILKSKNGKYYDRFRNRIMFPIIDIRNRVIGFGGRLITGEGPKYMNSPETPVYNKSTSLYGINIAKNSKAEKMVIVEGYMDCIALHQAGFSNCVASLGTALTIKQARMLKKLVPEVIIAYDMDQAGRNAALRGLDMIASLGCGVKVLEIPDGKDPDEYIKRNGNTAFGQLLESALPLVEYKAKLLREKYNINERDGRLKFLNGVAKAIAQVNNAIEHEMYVNRISSDYSISREALETEVLKNIKGGDNSSIDRPAKLISSLHVETGMEMKNFMAMAAIICARPELAAHAKELLDPDFIDEPSLKNMFLDILERVETKGISEAAIIMGDLEDSQRELFVAAVTYAETSADMNRTLEEKVNQYKESVINRKITRISSQLDNLTDKTGDEADRLNEKLTFEFNLLRNIKRK